jgi:cytochrome b6-f complex iron-sulfur subunit
MDQPRRRDVLRTGWKIGGALLVGTAVYTGYEALRPLTTGASAGPIEVGPISSFTQGTPVYVPAGRLYMVNLGQKIVALSQKCPHLGCRVDFCDSSGWFQCPCHGSKYDIGGEWIEGPAPRGLDEYPDVTLAADKKTVVVDTSKVEAGPPHGANQYYAPRKGPNC